MTETFKAPAEVTAGMLREDYQRLFSLFDASAVTVFREFIPRADEIEYTVFFRMDGIKYRLDLREKIEVFAQLPHDSFEGYMTGRVVQAIMDKRFVTANTALRAD